MAECNPWPRLVLSEHTCLTNLRAWILKHVRNTKGLNTHIHANPPPRIHHNGSKVSPPKSFNKWVPTHFFNLDAFSLSKDNSWVMDFCDFFIFLLAVCLDLHRRTPSAASAATAKVAAAKHPRRRCTIPQVLLSGAPHPELIHSTTAADVEATKHSGQSEVSWIPNYLPVLWLPFFFLKSHLLSWSSAPLSLCITNPLLWSLSFSFSSLSFSSTSCSLLLELFRKAGWCVIVCVNVSFWFAARDVKLATGLGWAWCPGC